MTTDQRHPPFIPRPGITLDTRELEIIAERVALLPITEQYAAEIFRTFDAQVTRYMTPAPAKEIAETMSFINSAREGMVRGNNLQFAITNKESGEFLGCCGLHGYDDPRIPELGIWLKTAAHGHAYGREAIFALKEWADAHIEYDYLIYPVDRANIPSRKIPEALGGQVFREALSPTPDGRILDTVVYKILPPGHASAEPPAKSA